MPPRKNTTTSRKNYSGMQYHAYQNYGGTCKPTTARSFTNIATTYSCNSPRFNTARTECQWRIGSYQNVYSQFTGTGMKTFFSPTTATKWIRYINSGWMVYKFNHKDFCRHFGNQWITGTPTTARRYLTTKYGTTIKDVTRGKGNCWLVATTRTPTARPFTNYTWR